jgi:hypothetical protein
MTIDESENHRRAISGRKTLIERINRDLEKLYQIDGTVGPYGQPIRVSQQSKNRLIQQRLRHEKALAELESEEREHAPRPNAHVVPSPEVNCLGVAPPTPAGLNYRSRVRIAVWSQLVKNPHATDLEICRGLDFDSDVHLPTGWKRKSVKHSVSEDYLFKEAYSDPKRRNKIHTLISKVRRDMRNRGLC